MVDRSADVSAICRSHDDCRGEIVIRPPSHRGKLVAELHVRGPDVIEELNFDDRLESANCETNCASDDVRFSKRRVVYARAPEFLLQSPRDLEYAALALHLAHVLFARHISHIFTEHQDLLITSHL